MKLSKRQIYKTIVVTIVIGGSILVIAYVLCIFATKGPVAQVLDNVKKGLESKVDETRQKEFGLEIEKIGVKAPVIANVNGGNQMEYNNSLTSGLAHLKNSGLPGQNSNIFIFGHSSSDIDFGPYSKIFQNLDNLDQGDKITIYYKSRKYEYSVTEKKVIFADDLTPVDPAEDEQLTLMTCWPVGKKDKRLIVIAK
jgi:LPXTG-site transpeptidase (sortase) family protein